MRIMIMYIIDYFYLHHPLLIKKPDRPNKLLSLLTSLGGWKERASSSFLMIKIYSLSYLIDISVKQQLDPLWVHRWKWPWCTRWLLKPPQKLPHNCCLTVNYEQCHVFCLYLIYWTSATATAILLPNNCDIIYTLNWTNFIWYDQCKIANKLLANRPINLLLLA